MMVTGWPSSHQWPEGEQRAALVLECDSQMMEGQIGEYRWQQATPRLT